MQRSPSFLSLSAAVLVLLIGCSRQGDQGIAAAAPQAVPVADSAVLPVAGNAPAAASGLPAAKAAPPPEAVQQAGVASDQLASSVNVANEPDRRFIRTASAQFQVKDVYAATLAIEDAVAAAQGFVVRNTISSSVQGSRRRSIGNDQMLVLSEIVTSGALVVRVPSARTQEFLRGIARQMQFLDQREFAAADAQFDLLRQALASARAQEVQRQVQMAAQQPGRTGDRVDAAQARVDLLATRDEATVARRELEDRIAFSTLTLNLQQPMQVREQTVPDTDAILRARGPGFFQRLGEALREGWSGLLTVVIGLAALWPLWLLSGLAVWAVRWLRRWLRRGRPVAATMPPAAPR